MASKKGQCAAVVAYPSKHPETGEPLKFDMDYYIATHMPLIHRAWSPFGMRAWSINQLPDPCPLTGATPPYLVQTTVYWDTVDDFRAALGGPMKDETAADVAKFSNVFPVIWIGEVREQETC